MLEADQLLKLMKRSTQPFTEFSEPPIDFPPTYRLIKDTDEYDYNRMPAYTDRVIVSGKSEHEHKIVRYDGNRDVKWGDHKPVFAQIEISNVKVRPGDTYEEAVTSHCCLV